MEVTKLEEAKLILRALGLPPSQQNDMSALTLLALAGIGPTSKWANARNNSVTVTKGIMAFVAQKYGRIYAPNTRETFRRQVLHQFVEAGIANYNPDDESLPTNSPKAHYALTPRALRTLKAYGTHAWEALVAAFLSEKESLASRYSKRRASQLIPVCLSDGTELQLSPGLHNQLQAAIVTEFAPRFVPGGRLLYLGDTAKKNFYCDELALRDLGITISDHDKLPDVLLLDVKNNRLVFVEAVTSHGPVSPKRVAELDQMFEACKSKRIYVTVFLDITGFRRHLKDIAWETEVWLANIPDHMIHFNGNKFLDSPNA